MPADGGTRAQCSVTAGPPDPATALRATQAGQPARLPLDVVEVLRSAGVRYAVVSAMAACVHGVVRASPVADAVAFIGTAQAQAQALNDTLATAGFSTSLRRADPDDPIAALVAMSDTRGNQVDLLVGRRGPSAQALERAIEVSLQGVALTVPDSEDFIATQLYAGGPQDLADAAAVAAAEPTTLDLALLQTLARAYGRETVARLEEMLTAMRT